MLYQQARKLATHRPVVHGNGFIQVWVGKGVRLHVWHPDCPKMDPYVGVHDHRFSFRSKIIRGRVVNRTWDADADGTAYDILTPGTGSEQDSWRLYSTGLMCSLTNGHEDVWGEGEEYGVNIGQIHDGLAHTPMAATLMQVTGRDRDHIVRVLCPTGLRYHHEFKRDAFEVDWLWTMIKEVLMHPPVRERRP